MHNVFLLYMPPGNAEAMVHYEDTIRKRVDLPRLAPFLSQDLRARLIRIFGSRRIAVWGSRAGPRNRSAFERMGEGDDVLIVEGGTIRFFGKVAAKTENAGLSRELWQPLKGGESDPWELIYFIANPQEVDIPFAEVGRLLGFSPNYQLRGFSTVAPEKIEAFFDRYGDLYSVLERLNAGKPLSHRLESPEKEVAPGGTDLVPLEREVVETVLQDELISDHTRMQWKLARLGLKASERVWVPAADQTKLRRQYQFDSFDDEFQAGLDLPHSYIENIDVVWKQEFRIGAAYEIENSTSIYSGLLRFADLNILAPNTLYPMFIVAPADRKNRLREQLRRPTFRKLELDKKVRFLSYEIVDEIDRFFEGAESGLSIDTIHNKSELVA